MISVVDGNTLAKFATFKSVEDAMPRDMWSITVQSILLTSWTFAVVTAAPTPMTMTSIPLWMTTREVRYVEPGV